jgi:hypothetical protein
MSDKNRHDPNLVVVILTCLELEIQIACHTLIFLGAGCLQHTVTKCTGNTFWLKNCGPYVRGKRYRKNPYSMMDL